VEFIKNFSADHMFDHPADVVAEIADFLAHSFHRQVGLLHLPVCFLHPPVELDGLIFHQSVEFGTLLFYRTAGFPNGTVGLSEHFEDTLIS
jgi:hypothetical protein